MGDESIMCPPASKKAATTSVHSSRRTGSSPTLNVIQVPSPMAGIASPEDKIVRVIGVPGAVSAHPGRAAAMPEAAAVCTNLLRVNIICQPQTKRHLARARRLPVSSSIRLAKRPIINKRSGLLLYLAPRIA